MIEVIYKDEKSGEENEYGFYLPRNIRQVGLIHENYRIYMEDYVYTFLGKTATLTTKTERVGCGAILTGEVRWRNGVTYIFVRGAVLIEGTEIAADHILLEEEIWEKIGKDCENYFADQEVVGWFLTAQGLPIRATDILTRAHVKYFGGEKILFLMDPVEKEDAFFRFENNFLIKQSGYYLYYEKNEAMQSYMLAQNEFLASNTIEKTEDKAVKNFRKKIQDKNKVEKREEVPSFFSYAATACLVLAVGALGARFYKNYQKIQNYELVQEAEPASSYEVQSVKPKKVSVTPEQKQESVQKTDPTSKPVSQMEKILTATEQPVRHPPLLATPTPLPELRQSIEKIPEKKNSESKSEAITKKESEANQEKPAAKETASQSKTYRYVVRPGDSLFQISLDRYGTIEKISEICKLNGFSEEEVIYPGQIIVLP